MCPKSVHCCPNGPKIPPAFGENTYLYFFVKKHEHFYCPRLNTLKVQKTDFKHTEGSARYRMSDKEQRNKISNKVMTLSHILFGTAKKIILAPVLVLCNVIIVVVLCIIFPFIHSRFSFFPC